MPALARAFSDRSAVKIPIRFDFDGSQILAMQLVHGAPADVFASADERWMRRAVSAGVADRPQAFARNMLAVVAPRGGRIRSLRDLASAGVRLDTCAEVVPCGAYARAFLARLNRDPAYGPFMTRRIRANMISQEQDVEAVVDKVLPGEADAGIAYQTDVRSYGPRIAVLPIPPRDKVRATYSIATVTSSRNSEPARAFIRFVRSPQGGRILRQFGFQAD